MPTTEVQQKAADEQIACPDCDTIFVLKPLTAAQRVVCPQCRARLCVHKPDGVARASAFALSAMVLFLVAHLFPFLTLEAGGTGNEIALGNSVNALYEYGSPWLALLVGVFIVVAPAVLIAGILYVLVPLIWGRAFPGAIPVCRWVFDTGPWNMIEVFMLGILVSMLKLTKIATVHLGVSFWAFALLIAFVTASFGSIDRTDLWRRLERARS